MFILIILGIVFWFAPLILYIQEDDSDYLVTFIFFCLYFVPVSIFNIFHEKLSEALPDYTGVILSFIYPIVLWLIHFLFYLFISPDSGGSSFKAKEARHYDVDGCYGSKKTDSSSSENGFNVYLSGHQYLGTARKNNKNAYELYSSRESTYKRDTMIKEIKIEGSKIVITTANKDKAYNDIQIYAVPDSPYEHPFNIDNYKYVYRLLDNTGKCLGWAHLREGKFEIYFY